MATTRAEGFYWVRRSDGSWVVASYHDGYWQFVGKTLVLDEAELFEDGCVACERIREPGE